MKVYFVGAGPGASDLITIRGAAVLRRVKVVLYAGSLVPEAVLEHCCPEAKLINTAFLDLEQQVAHIRQAAEAGLDVARVHSGDPAIYGATAEQMARLDELGIAWEVIPGVSSFTAAAAVIGSELTQPEVSQTVILTRVSGRASAVPEAEAILRLGSHQATMCIFLSGPHLRSIVTDLLQHYPPDTPIVLVYRASCPEQRVHRSSLSRVLDEVRIEDWQLTTMLLVGRALDRAPSTCSQLYSPAYSHRFRRSARQ